jgi:hypothetical protein
MAKQDIKPVESNRVLLWGVDVVASQTNRGIELYLLEVNVHPQLFRGCQICDRLVEDMLYDDYLPALLGKATFA